MKNALLISLLAMAFVSAAPSAEAFKFKRAAIVAVKCPFRLAKNLVLGSLVGLGGAFGYTYVESALDYDYND